MIKKPTRNLFKALPFRILAIAMLAIVALSLPVSACHIGDFVWDDLNGNGIHDSGEMGIAGVTVKLYKSTGGNSIATTTTNSNGIYKFAVTNNKDYKVKFILPSGYEFSPKDQGQDDKKDSDADVSGMTTVIKIRNSKDDYTIDAGMYKPASVGNFVWNDEDNNGIQDAVELGIEGIEVELYTFNGAFVAKTTTDGNGCYEFTGLTPGSYYMQFVNPSGSVFAPQQKSTPATDSDAGPTGTTPCFTLISGEYNQDIDAGLYFPPQQEIPEFPTVGLPIASIIGLAFIMQRRKE